MAKLKFGDTSSCPAMISEGSTDLIIAAQNGTGKTISKDSKVWLNKSIDNTYTIVPFEQLQINCGLTGSDVIIDANGVASGFSSSSYLSYWPIPVYNKFETVVKFTTGSDVTTMQNIVRYNGFTEIYIANGTLLTWSEQTLSAVSCGTVEANRTYYVKLVVQNNVAELSYSTNGVTYTGNVTIDNNIKTSSSFNIGYCHSGNAGRYFRGFIDLMNSYIQLNNTGVDYWRGAKKLPNQNFSNDYTQTGIANANIAVNASGNVRILNNIISIPTTLGSRIDDKATVVGVLQDHLGNDYILAVVDAQYRSDSPYPWGPRGEDSSIAETDDTQTVINDAHSGEYNTNLMASDHTLSYAPAFNVARNACVVVVNGNIYQSCLPSMRELELIRVNRQELDTYDPTLSFYSARSLTDFTCGGTRGVWASNEINTTGAWVDSANGPDYLWGRDKANNTDWGVCPVICIPLS